MAELHLLSPRGFRGAGVYAGIKTSIRRTWACWCAHRAPATAAAVFTTNKVFAAPVKVGREHMAGGKLRGVVVNAGNANACTGRQGEKDARRMCQLAAEVHRLPSRSRSCPSRPGSSATCCRWRRSKRGIRDAGAVPRRQPRARPAVRRRDPHDRPEAQGRRRRGEDRPPDGDDRRRLQGQRHDRPADGVAVPAKAAQARHARDDAGLPHHRRRRPRRRCCGKLLGAAADASFNAVTVDDHTSTNDTAAILASGASGAKIDSPARRRKFAAALDEVCQSLAYQIAADGEGATKVVMIKVKAGGARSGAPGRWPARSPTRRW